MTTVNVAVGASADDADETDSGASFTSSAATGSIVSSTTASTRKNVGTRLPSTTIPQGSTIASSTTQVYVTAGTSVLCHIFGEAADAAVDYVANADVTTRLASSATTANVAWNATGLTKTAFNTTPALDSVYQEVVNRAGFSGGAINLLFGGDNSATGRNLSVQSYDGSTSNCTKASITYTAPAASAGNERQYPRGVLRGTLRGVA